jgi:dihydrofolate reductase
MFEWVVAKTDKGVIGKDGVLPWHIPEDLKHFKKLTLGRSVIMGRRTWDEIYQRLGAALPKRKNIVLTSRPLPANAEAFAARCLDEAVSLAQKESQEEPMVIGGAQLYQATLPQVSVIHLTEVRGDYEGDTYFPKLDMDAWNETLEAETEQCRFITLRRKS